MIDVPKLGLELLNNAATKFAESCEDPDEFEEGMALFDTARKLVGRTRLRKAITETSDGSADQTRREKDVMRALTEVIEVRRMI